MNLQSFAKPRELQAAAGRFTLSPRGGGQWGVTLEKHVVQKEDYVKWLWSAVLGEWSGHYARLVRGCRHEREERFVAQDIMFPT